MKESLHFAGLPRHIPAQCNSATLEGTVTRIRRDGGEATGVAGDVADPAALERLREETEQTYGPTEVLGRSSAEAFHPSDPPPRSLRRSGTPPSAATSP